MDENPAIPPTPDEHQAALRDMAQRLLIQPGPDACALDAPQLLLGQLPPEIPLPDGARLVGSLVRPLQSTVVLDTDQSPEQVLAFYAGTDVRLVLNSDPRYSPCDAN